MKYEERHENVLEAAIKLFNNKGYAGITTASIAKKAGVVGKTMFNRYADNQALFDACVGVREKMLGDYKRSGMRFTIFSAIKGKRSLFR